MFSRTHIVDDFKTIHAELARTHVEAEEKNKLLIEFQKWLGKQLVQAADSWKPHTVDLLLAGGADVHAQENSALMAASARGSADIVDILLKAGADVHARDDLALQLAVTRGGCEDTIELLLGAGASLYAAWKSAEAQGYSLTVRALQDYIRATEKKAQAATTIRDASTVIRKGFPELGR